MSHICIVVPLYINHPSLYPIVQRFFDSLEAHYPDINLYVIDDASPLPHDFLINAGRSYNLGFTATVNEGLAAMFNKANMDTVIVLNDDLVLKPGDLDRFFNLNPEKPVIASPRDTSSDDTDKWGAVWGITRAAWNLLGPMDERYKHFFSDRDYYDRAKAAGVEIVKWHDIVVEHAESATYNTLDKAAMLEADMQTYTETHNG